MIFEFLLNALRLRDGFTFENFERNTGLDKSEIINACKKVDNELLEIKDTGIQTSKKGYEFLNDVLQTFL